MNNLVDLFLQLVQIDSPTGEEEKVGEFIISYLKARDIASQKDKRGNITAKVNGTGKALMLSAHMDTVEPGRAVKPIVKDGYVTSDGTTILGGDNKIGLSAILYTLDQIKNLKHRPIDLIFTVSEEAGFMGSGDVDTSKIESKEGYCFDTTNPIGTIVTASPFYERFNLQILGKAAHASLPETGNNVLFVLQEFLNSTKLGKINEDTTINIGIVNAGDGRNTIPGTLDIKGEIRSFIEEKLENEKAKIIEVLSKLESKFKVKINQVWEMENPGYKLTSDDAMRFMDQTEKVVRSIGITPNRIQAGGCSDANFFNFHGLLCLCLGDGGELAHTREERVKISELEKLAKLINTLVTA